MPSSPRVIGVVCGPLPVDWSNELARASQDSGEPVELVELPVVAQAQQALAAVGAYGGPLILFAPRQGTYGGLTCALTLCRLLFSWPVLEWSPGLLPETLDTAKRISALLGETPSQAMPSAPPPGPSTSALSPSSQPKPTQDSLQPPSRSKPPQPMPVYVQKRKLRLGRRDLELPGEYEQQLQRREKTVPEPPPPPPLPLGEVLQHALARAGARVLLQPDGSATIDSLDLLLALLDLKEGAIQQILEKAQSPSEELAAKLRLLANRPLRDPLPPGTQKSGIAPEESLRNLLQQTRREGRSRGSAVATSRDFLRSILAIHPDLVELLQRANAKIDLLRELMDEVDFPDDDELKLREQLPEEPFAQKGWNDPLAGLDSVTRRELLQGNASPDPIPVSQLLPLPIETGSEPTKSIPDVTAQSLPFPQTPIVRPLSSAPSPPGGRLRKLTLYNPDLPSPDLIDRASDLLNSGHLIIFPTDLGASALVLLESEDKASELLRYRRSLGQGHTEVLTHQIQTMGQYLPPEFLSTHRKVLAELADLAVAVRLPWSQRHSAIDALDETPRSGWHRGWRVPAHTALLALLATLGKPLLALPSPSNDPQLNALLHHDSRPVGLLVDTPNPSPVTRPAILDLRARPAKLEDPGLPPADPAILRPILQSLSP